MNTLDALLHSAECFAQEAWNALTPDERESIGSAVECGCMIELRICATAASRVRMLLLTPDGRHEMPVGRLIERHHN